MVRWFAWFVSGDDGGGFASFEIGEIEWQTVGEQFKKNDTQRVNIGLHAYAVAANLFGCGVGWRHHAHDGARLIDRGIQVFDLLGDSEIEQAHAAVSLNKDVRRLQVAMNDRMRMGILNCLADLAEQLQPALDGAVVLLAIVGDRQAFDVLHDEPRSAIGESVSIVETRDGRMIELRLHALFAGEALASGRREPGVTENFDGDQVAEVFALAR